MTDLKYRETDLRDQMVAERRKTTVRAIAAAILLVVSLFLFSLAGESGDVDLGEGAQTQNIPTVPVEGPAVADDAPAPEEGASFDTAVSVALALEYVRGVVSAPQEEGVAQVTGPAPTLSNETAHTIDANPTTGVVWVRVIGDLSWDGAGRVAQWTVEVDQPTLTVLSLQVG